MDNKLYINTPRLCVKAGAADGHTGSCDGNVKDVIKECTHNILQCALLEDLTLGEQCELGHTGGKGWVRMWL